MSKQHTEQLLHIAAPRFNVKKHPYIQSSDLHGEPVPAGFLAPRFSFPKRVKL